MNGLRNANSAFQRLMDYFQAGLINQTLAVYLDDLTVISDVLEKHIRDLNSVLERICIGTQTDMTLNNA